MLGRKLILVGATLVASGVYGGMYVLAPDIYLIRANASREIVEERFKVDLLREMPINTFSNEKGLTQELDPLKTVNELLERETSLMPEVDRIPIEPVPIPELLNRLDNKTLPREHDFEIDDDVFRGIDAQILEIAEQHARKDIDVPRRLVKPSSNRILAKDELPVFRGGEGGVAAGGTVSLPRSVDMLDQLMSAMDAASAEEVGKTGPTNPLVAMDADQDIFHPDLIEPDMRFLPEDVVLARNPVKSQIDAESNFDSMDSLVNIDVQTYVDQASGQGYFEVKIAPDPNQTIGVLPRDVTFVIDASNSIAPRKLQLTIRGVTSCLSMLRPEDHFNIIVFRGSPTFFSQEMTPATPETIAQATKFIEPLESSGSTDVYSAIQPVLHRPPRTGVPGIVIVLTDGRPTEGNLEGRHLINALSDENLLGNTIYTFGGGKTVNQYLLDLLAYRNKGRSYTFPQIEEIDAELPRFFARLNDAYLVDLAADYGRIDKNMVYPRDLPDFYKGQVVTLYGRFTPSEDKDLVMRLEGSSGLQRREMVLKADLANAAQGDASIAKYWAFQKVYYLIGEVSRYGETPELMAEITRLSQQYGVQSTYYAN